MANWAIVDLYLACGGYTVADQEYIVTGAPHIKPAEGWLRLMAFGCALLWLGGLVIVLTKIAPASFFETYFCSVLMLDCFMRTSHGHHGLINVIYVYSMMLAGVRLCPFIVTVLMIAMGIQVHNAIFSCGWMCKPSLVWSFVAFVLVDGAHQSELRCLYDAQHSLAVKNKATARLLSSVCDVACWLAADGLTILEGDPRLDAILGCKAENTQFTCYLPVEERQRFQSAKASAAKGSGTKQRHDPVVLLPSTLNGAGCRPCQVDLFIEDVRAELGTAEERNLPGFLVGIRLAIPDCAVMCMAECDPESPAIAASPPLYRGSTLESDGVASSHGGAASLPETLLSPRLPQPVLHNCTREALHRALLSGTCEVGLPTVESPRARGAVLASLDLICNHASGGVLFCVAEADAFEQVLGTGVPGAPCTQSSDQGYMTDSLRGIHIRDARFQDSFREYTRHTHNDRWPEDHPDEWARGRPKDGAFLLSTDGYRVKCSAKLLGLTAPVRWEGVGTKHEAALACAWAIPGASVFVKSDSGSLHFVQKRETTLHVYQVDGDGFT